MKFLKNIMKFGLRLKLKNSVNRLKGARQDEYVDNLRALHRIDPYRYLLWAVSMVVALAVFVSLKWAMFLLAFYTLWIVFYGITFIGVAEMYKDSLEKQDLEEDVLRKKM